MSDRLVLFFGDSFTAGVGDPTGLGWVGRVVVASHARGLPMTYYNLGVRRETSTDIATRLRSEIAPRLLHGADCRVVLALGANDTMEENGRSRVEQSTSAATLTRMLADLSAMSLPVFVIGPGPVGDEEQLTRIALLSDAFGDVCRAASVPFVPVSGPLAVSGIWSAEAAQGDGAHPGAGGYQEFARIVLDGGWLAWLES